MTQNYTISKELLHSSIRTRKEQNPNSPQKMKNKPFIVSFLAAKRQDNLVSKVMRLSKRSISFLVLTWMLGGGFQTNAAEPTESITMPGKYLSHTSNGNILNISTQTQDVRIELCKSNMVRVRSKPKSVDFLPDKSFLIEKYAFEPVRHSIKETDEFILIKTDDLVVRVQKDPIRIHYFESNGMDSILSGEEMGYDAEGGNTVSFNMDSGGVKEDFFGLGVNADFNHRSKAFRVWMSSKAKHYVAPFVLSSRGYGIFNRSSYDTTFDFTKSKYLITATGGQIDYYFIYSPAGEYKDLISDYTELTGRPALPPKKALGFKFAGEMKESGTEYYTGIVDEFRKRGLAIDGFSIDGWQPNEDIYPCKYIWDTGKFPDPAKFAKEMAKKNALLTLWKHPFVHQESPLRKANSGFDISPYLFDHKTGFSKRNGGLAIDLTSEEARNEFNRYMNTVAGDLGIYNFKLDETDEFIGSEAQLPSGMTGSEYRNIFGSLALKTTFDNAKNLYNKRSHSFVRGLFTGSQRYPSTGYSDTYDINEYIRFNVNSAFGAGYVVPELRGDNEGNDDLYLRRVQLTMFAGYPFANEWQRGNLPWNRSEKAFEGFKKYNNLRTMLIPYIYSNFKIQSESGLALLRALPVEFPKDKNSNSVSDQYMFGEFMMIAPESQPGAETSRKIYLPEGTDWYDYNTGKKYTGGKSIVYFSDSDTMPIFVKAGAIIPMSEFKPFTEAGTTGNLILDVYPMGDSQFFLYEDDGESFDYEKGEFATTEYSTSKSDGQITFTIGERVGSYKPETRNITVQLHVKNKPTALTINGNQTPFNYADEICEISFPDDGKKKVIQMTVDTNEVYDGDLTSVTIDGNTDQVIEKFANLDSFTSPAGSLTRLDGRETGARFAIDSDSSVISKSYYIDSDKVSFIRLNVQGGTNKWALKIKDGNTGSSTPEFTLKSDTADAGEFLIDFGKLLSDSGIHLSGERFLTVNLYGIGAGHTDFAGFELFGNSDGDYLTSEKSLSSWNTSGVTPVFTNPGMEINPQKDVTISKQFFVHTTKTPFARLNIKSGDYQATLDGVPLDGITDISSIGQLKTATLEVQIKSGVPLHMDSIEFLSPKELLSESFKTIHHYSGDPNVSVVLSSTKDFIELQQFNRDLAVQADWMYVGRDFHVDLAKYSQLSINIGSYPGTFYDMKLVDKNGKTLTVLTQVDRLTNKVIDLEECQRDPEFIFGGEEVYRLEIGIKDTRQTQEGIVTIKELRFRSGGMPSAFLGNDLKTGNNWMANYGGTGYNIVHVTPVSNIPTGTIINHVNGSVFQFPGAEVANPLPLPTKGNSHSVIFSGEPLLIDVSTDQPQKVSIYMSDYGINRSNEQTLEMIDKKSGAVLSTHRVVNFQEGQYYSYCVHGDVRFQITPHAGNAVMSAIFIDELP